MNERRGLLFLQECCRHMQPNALIVSCALCLICGFEIIIKHSSNGNNYSCIYEVWWWCFTFVALECWNSIMWQYLLLKRSNHKCWDYSNVILRITFVVCSWMTAFLKIFTWLHLVNNHIAGAVIGQSLCVRTCVGITLSLYCGIFCCLVQMMSRGWKFSDFSCIKMWEFIGCV